MTRPMLLTYAAIGVLVLLLLAAVGPHAIGAQTLTSTAPGHPATVHTPQGTPTPPVLALVKIVIATRFIPQRSVVAESAVALHDWPATEVPAGALTEVRAAIGNIATGDVLADQPILATLLTSGPPTQATMPPFVVFLPAEEDAVLPVDPRANIPCPIRVGNSMLIAFFDVPTLDTAQHQSVPQVGSTWWRELSSTSRGAAPEALPRQPPTPWGRVGRRRYPRPPLPLVGTFPSPSL